MGRRTIDKEINIQKPHTSERPLEASEIGAGYADRSRGAQDGHVLSRAIVEMVLEVVWQRK